MCMCEFVIFLMCVCVCDKCNDFVFHYLLDYSCRVFVSFFLFLVDSALLSAHSQKTVDFNRNVGCRKFVRTCSLFSAQRFQHTLQSSSFEFTSSKLFGVVFPSVCAPFYRILFASGSRRLQSALFSRGDSLLFPASICCNFCFTFG